MGKVQLSKHIYRDCQTFELGCWAHKFIKLPYPPFVGLSIHDGQGEVMEIKLIQYDCGTKVTSCFVGYEDHEDYEHAKEHAKEWGWKMREVPKGTIANDLTNFFLNKMEDLF